MERLALLERTPVRPAGSTYLAEVVSVSDPDGLGRVQVRLLSFDGPDAQNGPMWARVAVPFAGGERGAFLLPDMGDEVLVTFVNGDPRLPVVIGGLWSQSQPPPESLGGDRVDRWTIVGKAGTRIAVVEESAPTISLTTPAGVRAEFTDDGSGRIELRAAGARITIDSRGVSIRTGATVSVQASQVKVSAGQVQVDAAFTTFSGFVKCDVLQTNTVISPVYTPGAGNIW